MANPVNYDTRDDAPCWAQLWGCSAINLRYSTAAGALKMAQRFWANTNLIDASPFDRIFSHCLFKPLYA